MSTTRSGVVTITVTGFLEKLVSGRVTIDAREGVKRLGDRAAAGIRRRLEDDGHKQTGTLSRSLEPKVAGSGTKATAKIEPAASRHGWLERERVGGNDWISTDGLEEDIEDELQQFVREKLRG